MSAPPRTPVVALSAWYAAGMASGALAPWLAVLLTDTGWSSAEASALLLALPAGRLVGGPLWAWLADASSPERVLRGPLLVTTLSCAAMWLAESPLPVFLAIVSWALARAPAMPIVDATTVGLVGRRYGRIRAVGSAAFLAVAAANGFLRDAWGAAPVLLATALSALTLLLAFGLPRLAIAPAPPTLRSLARLVHDPVIVPLAAICVLHGASLSVYDHLFALHVEALGLSSAVTGAGLATGVTVEIVVLALGHHLLRRLGPMALFVLAVASGVPRFWLTGEATAALPLVLAQGLHGVQFGAFWVAGTAMFAEHAPPDLRHSTQAILPAAAFGAGPLVGLLAGSVVLSRADTGTLFEAMAGVSLAAVLLAVPLLFRRQG